MELSEIKVASVPHGHVYVRHLADPDGTDRVVRLDDPKPDRTVVGAPWWPAVMLNPTWIAGHAEEFDLYHVHFGFDAVDPDHLRDVVETLRAHHKPLVYTVHDLRNPHQADRRAHDAALDVLVPAADALITLTPGAAAEIERRWGRRATVVPHPHVVELDEMARPRPERARRAVGLHLKSMRANMAPLPVLEVLLTECTRRDLDLVIDVHTDVVTPGMCHYDRDVVAFLECAATRPNVRIQGHDYYTDAELWDYFRSLDLSVLAYRFGTHSGWLEACYDLGTRVLAPRIGYYHDQHPGVLGYRLDEDGLPLAEDIVAALDLLDDTTAWRADPKWRRDQRRSIAAAHRQVYESVLETVRV